jgi:2'-5' RNA ligase
MEKGALKREFFIAVFLPEEVARQVEKQLRKDGEIKGWEWKRPTEYHISIAFPGRLSEQDVEHVIKALQKVDMKSFDMSLSGLSYFLRRQNRQDNNRHVLWLRPDNNADNALRELNFRVTETLQNSGFLPGSSREITPHVTLAKPPTTDTNLMQDFARAAAGFQTDNWRCAKFVLCETLGRDHPDHPANNPSGSRYKVLAEFNLG